MSTAAVTPVHHGFFSAVWNFFKSLGHHANTWEKAVSVAIDVAAPLTQNLILVTAGEPAADEFKNVVTEVQNSLALVKGVVSTAQANAGADPALIAKAQGALESVKANLSGLLTAGHIKNEETRTKAEAIGSAIIGEVQAMLNLIPTGTQAGS